MEMITLKCPDCKGTLSVDEEHMLVKCPYCGCEKLIVEDKEITLKRLDIKKKKLEMEDDERKYQRQKEDDEEESFGEMFKWFLGMLLMCGCLAAFILLITYFVKLMS